MDQQTREPTPNPAAKVHQEFISKDKKTCKMRLDINQLVKKLSQSNKCNLSSKYYSLQVLSNIFEKVENYSDIQMLYLQWNKEPEIISIPIMFPMPNLKILNIGGNRIVSLQLLHKASFEKLEQLWMWSNHLLRVDSLRKCCFPSLRLLEMGSNHITECPKLSEMHAPMLKLISFENNGFHSLTNFTKLIMNTSSELTLRFTCNKLVKTLFQEPQKKGKKMANQLKYTLKDGKANLSFF